MENRKPTPATRCSTSSSKYTIWRASSAISAARQRIMHITVVLKILWELPQLSRYSDGPNSRGFEGSIPRREKIFSLFHSVKTDSGGQPSLLWKGYRGLFPGIKGSRREAEIYFHVLSASRMVELYMHSPYIHGHMVNYLRTARTLLLLHRSVAGRIRSIKTSNDLVWNRTRNLPACSKLYQLRYRVLLCLEVVGLLIVQWKCIWRLKSISYAKLLM
jgi:hypothetical protein